MAGGAPLGDGRAFARRMTRCECAEMTFDEVARQVQEEGRSLEAIQDRTGCGRLCTACLPDLREHLAARS
jgi:bacterioferritin-associated ferredoxin